MAETVGGIGQGAGCKYFLASFDAVEDAITRTYGLKLGKIIHNNRPPVTRPSQKVLLTMSTEQQSKPERQKIQLKGTPPENVTGKMNPEKLLEVLEEARAERTLEEDERSWRELDRILREDPV